MRQGSFEANAIPYIKIDLTIWFANFLCLCLWLKHITKETCTSQLIPFDIVPVDKRRFIGVIINTFSGTLTYDVRKQLRFHKEHYCLNSLFTTYILVWLLSILPSIYPVFPLHSSLEIAKTANCNTLNIEQRL